MRMRMCSMGIWKTAPKYTAAFVNRNKFVRAVEKMNACNLWSTWFMDAYLFINQECPVSILLISQAHHTNANRVNEYGLDAQTHRREKRKDTHMWEQWLEHLCLLAFVFMSVCGCAYRTANPHSTYIHTRTHAAQLSISSWRVEAAWIASTPQIYVIIVMPLASQPLFSISFTFILKENKFICNILLLRTCQNGWAWRMRVLWCASESDKWKFE